MSGSRETRVAPGWRVRQRFRDQVPIESGSLQRGVLNELRSTAGLIPWGTEGSNPPSSCGESTNSRSLSSAGGHPIPGSPMN
jgi:hypothetical protein